MALKFYIPSGKIIKCGFRENNTSLIIQFYDLNGKEDRIEVDELEKEYFDRIKELLKNNL